MNIRTELVRALQYVEQAEDNYDTEYKRQYYLRRADEQLKRCKRMIASGLMSSDMNAAERFIHDKLEIDIDVLW